MSVLCLMIVTNMHLVSECTS